MGSGLVIVILACIVRNIPDELKALYEKASILGVPAAIALTFAGAVVAVAVIVFVIWFNMGGKKLRILFSKRTVGMKQYAMQNQTLPLKVAQAGTMPIVYTVAILLIPAVIMCLVMPEGTTNVILFSFVNFKRSLMFYLLFCVFAAFFTYLFSMIQFNPMDMSNQIKQNGGYIQGLRPGKTTSQYLMTLYTNLNLADAAFLICLSLVPMLLDLIPALTGIWFAGMVCIMLGGGFIELKTVLENGISAEEEKAKAISKERKNKYAK